MSSEKNNIPCQKWKQQLEINKDGLCNSLTTISKDNLVLEICKKQ